MSEVRCIVAIVERGKADKIVDKAKKQELKELRLFMEEVQGKAK